MSDAFKHIANLSPQEKRALLVDLLQKKARESTSVFPLSHGQRALWFLHQLDPGSAAYNLAFGGYIRPGLDVPAFRRTVQKLVDRHPSLRTTYTVHNGELVQQVHGQTTPHLEVVDASSWVPDDLRDRLEEEADRPFNLEQGPVFREKLFTRGAHEHVLLLTAHHIALDFWSLDVILAEFLVLYLAESAGSRANLPPLGAQYSDFVAWQVEMLAGPEGDRLLGYWQKRLAGKLPVLDLPTDRPRLRLQRYRGGSHEFSLNEGLARRLETLAKREGTTLYATLLTAFFVLLHRYTAQVDILVGSPAAGRGMPGCESIVGYFVNPVVMRADLSGDSTFGVLLSQVRQTVLEALEHQDVPFALLVERLQANRDPSRSPLFQVEFVWDALRLLRQHNQAPSDMDETPEGANRGGLSLEPFLKQRGAPFDLTLKMVAVGKSLSGAIQYNVDLFDAATIARMAGHFQTLLEGIVASPDARLSALPLLTESERRQILVEWNDTRTDYPDTSCLHELFESQVERSPDAVAVVFQEERLTYRELNRRADRLARRLKALGVGPDVLAGICAERSVEMVVGLLGILKAGGAYVPLDPTYPKERLAFMLEDAHVPVLLTQRRLVEGLPRHVATVVCLDEDVPIIGEESARNPVSGAVAENLAYVIYTSGSTGRPKGVMITHRGICNRLRWMQGAYHLTEADRVLQKTPLSFDVSVWEVFWPLLTGARLVVAKPGGHLDPAYLLKLISDQGITTLHFVPSMLRVFLEERGLDACHSVRRVICSGEPLTVALQERFFERLAAELHNLYGPTEASIDVTCWSCTRTGGRQTVPIGRPIANTQIYILDSHVCPVPVGIAGELHIGSVGLARGYLNQPALTAEKFIPDPFSNAAGARIYRTGDLARYLRDGTVEFLGRMDGQVKVGGCRIELKEIEAVLDRHPAVREAVVVARDDLPGGRGLVAYVLPQPESAPTARELRSVLKRLLPDYMVPAAFVLVDTLPLMPNGKLDTRALPSVEAARPEVAEAYVAPRNRVEALLADAWAQALGIDKVGVHDNYFELGGASLQILLIVAKVNAEGLHLSPEMFLQYPTIAELAEITPANPTPEHP